MLPRARGEISERLLSELTAFGTRAAVVRAARSGRSARRRGPPAGAVPLLRAPLPRPARRRRALGVGAVAAARCERCSSSASSDALRERRPAPRAARWRRRTSIWRCGRSPRRTARRCRPTSSAQRRHRADPRVPRSPLGLPAQGGRPALVGDPAAVGRPQGGAGRDPGRRVRRRARGVDPRRAVRPGDAGARARLAPTAPTWT